MKTLHSTLQSLLLGVLFFVQLPVLAVGNSNPATATAFAQGQSAIRFIENKGQIKQTNGEAAPFVGFVLERGGTKLFLLKSGGIAYQFEKFHYPEGYLDLMRERHPSLEQQAQLDQLRERVQLETYRMDMTLLGANPNATIITEGRSEDYTNYYNHNVLDVHHYRKVTYKDVYPGIDWVLYTTEKGMKYDFIVSPGADPNLIRLQFTHHEELRIDEQDNLIHGNRMGSFTEEAPISFQGSAQVDTRYKLNGDVLSFQLGAYDPNQTLTIDPNRIWGTYYGGGALDVGTAITTDAFGNVYLAGETSTSSIIATPGTHQTTFAGGGDAFLVKFDGNGVRQWGTYYGGTGNEIGHELVMDPSGNIYLAGQSSSTSEIATSGAHQLSIGGGNDGFLVKFDGNGIRLWGTFYGGTGNEIAYGLATDGNGNVYVAGNTTSLNGIAGSGAFQTIYGGVSDAFLVKFDGNGVRQWSTYYGGTASDESFRVTTDASANVYLAGRSASTSGISTPGAHQSISGGGGDAFLVKFNTDGVRQWATYYGGTNIEIGLGVAADLNGNVYFGGQTLSASQIATPGAYQTNLNGVVDGFVVKFDGNGIRQWGTYFGGSASDQCNELATDAIGNVYLAGQTQSVDAIATPSVHQTAFGGVGDAFVVKFDGNGVLQWGTYYGGSGNDISNGVATYANDYVYMTGRTPSPNAMASPSAHQTTYGGSTDAFLVKFASCIPPTVTASNNGPICTGATLNLTASGAATYSWTGPNGFTSSLQNPSIPNATAVNAGVYQVVGINGNGCTDTALTTVVVPKPILSSAGELICSASPTTTLTVNELLVGPNPVGTITWYSGTTCSGGAQATGVSWSPTLPSLGTVGYSAEVTGACNGVTTCQNIIVSIAEPAISPSNVTSTAGFDICDANPYTDLEAIGYAEGNPAGGVIWYSGHGCSGLIEEFGPFFSVFSLLPNANNMFSVNIGGGNCNDPSACLDITITTRRPAQDIVAITSSNGLNISSSTPTTTLTATGGSLGANPAGVISWYNGSNCSGAVQATGPSWSPTLPNTGTADFSVNISGACSGGSGCQSITITITNPPVIPNCSILENILSAPTQALNANERFMVENTAANIPQGAVFNWNFSGANVLSGTGKGPYTLSFPSPGVYTISVSYSVAGCTTRTASRQMEINPECEAVPSYTAGTITATRAQINWTNATPEQGFVLNYRPQGSSKWILQTVPTNATNFLLVNLQPLTTYEFVVRRICGFGLISSLQDQPLQTFTTNSDPDVCEAPLNFVQTGANASSLTVEWDAAPAAEKYIVQIRKVGTNPWRNRTVRSVFARSHTFTNLQFNTAYQVWINAVCPGGQPSTNVIIIANTFGGKR